jgi:hypothetical protein
MSADPEREPLLPAEPNDDPKSQDVLKSGTCAVMRTVTAQASRSPFVSAAPNHLTGETFDNVPVHKRKLGELRTLP